VAVAVVAIVPMAAIKASFMISWKVVAVGVFSGDAMVVLILVCESCCGRCCPVMFYFLGYSRHPSCNAQHSPPNLMVNFLCLTRRMSSVNLHNTPPKPFIFLLTVALILFHLKRMS